MPRKLLYDSNFLLTCVAQFFFVTGNALLVHFARWIAFLGGDERDIGWIMGLGPVLALLIRPRIGHWIDQFGPKKLWAAGTVIFAATAAAMGVFHHLHWSIYVLRIIHILGPAIIMTTGYSYVALTTPVERRAEALGSLGLGGFTGLMIGPTLGDFFLTRLPTPRAGFVTLFLVAGAMGLISFLIVLFFLRSEKRSGPRRRPQFIRTVRQYWPGPILIACLALGVCMAVPFGFLSRFIDVIGVGRLGPFFWVYAGCGFVVRLVFRRLPDELGPKPVAALGFFCFAAGLATYPYVDAVWKLALPALLSGVGHAFMFNTIATLAMRPFPPDVQGTGSAMFWIAIDTGFLAGGPLIGSAAYYLGYGPMFYMVAALCVAAGVLLIRMPATERNVPPQSPLSETHR